MGAGRRSVCFDNADNMALNLLPETVQTKNTFVHFETRMAGTRRATCTGAMLSLCRDSKEATAGTRRTAARGNARSATCRADFDVVAVLQIPQLGLKGHRNSLLSVVEELSPSSTGASPMSPLMIGGCFETPTMCYVPSPRAQVQTPPVQYYYAVQSQMPELWQGCVTPVAASTPVSMVSVSPCSTVPASPTMFAQLQPWALSPMSLASTPPMTPLTSPRSVASDLLQGVWQPLESAKAQEPKRKREKKESIPARPNELTVMLRHLPLSFSPDGLLAKFESYLPFIDFYYLPTNFETKKNLGYAFLNFTDKSVAARFKAFWMEAGIAESSEECVLDARVQGYAENVERFRNSSVMGVLPEDLKPRIFYGGVAQQFPAAGKALPPVGARFRPTGQ